MAETLKNLQEFVHRQQNKRPEVEADLLQWVFAVDKSVGQDGGLNGDELLIMHAPSWYDYADGSGRRGVSRGADVVAATYKHARNRQAMLDARWNRYAALKHHQSTHYRQLGATDQQFTH